MFVFMIVRFRFDLFRSLQHQQVTGSLFLFQIRNRFHIYQVMSNSLSLRMLGFLSLCLRGAVNFSNRLWYSFLLDDGLESTEDEFCHPKPDQTSLDSFKTSISSIYSRSFNHKMLFAWAITFFLSLEFAIAFVCLLVFTVRNQTDNSKPKINEGM